MPSQVKDLSAELRLVRAPALWFDTVSLTLLSELSEHVPELQAELQAAANGQLEKIDWRPFLWPLLRRGSGITGDQSDHATSA